MSRAPTLSGLDPSFGTPARVREAACDALDRGETHYTTRPGLVELREATRTLLREYCGVEVQGINGVLITCGEAEGLFVALRTLLSSGDEVLTVAPLATSDQALLASLEVSVATAGVGDPQRPRLQPAEVAAAITDRTRVLMVRTPGATGVPLDARDLELLAEQARAADLAVVAVETGQTSYHSEHRPGLAAHLDASTPYVVVGEFGSPWGLEAWRVGYLAGVSQLVAPMTELKQALTICSPAVSQFAALAAITAPRDEAAGRLRELGRRAAAFADACLASGLQVIRPEAGDGIFVKPPHSLPNETEAVDRLAREGISAYPGGLTGLPGWLRLTLTVTADSAPETVRRILELMDGEERDD